MSGLSRFKVHPPVSHINAATTSRNEAVQELILLSKKNLKFGLQAMSVAPPIHER